MQTVILSLTHEHLQILNAALIEAPYRLVAPLINEINTQLRQQYPSGMQSTSQSETAVETTEA